VRLSSFARSRRGEPRRVSARAIAVLGILAILFQATLGAWHHHALIFSSRAAGAAASAPTNEEAPNAADRHCQICFSLGHHGGVPVDWFAAALPIPYPRPPIPAVDVTGRLPAHFLFHARAPPLSEVGST
jgi:hypothetical protein